tara:strand:+ start:6057 stop:6467 length:411 start_codon:yes stop_codon:yes gene_type:complete
LYYHGSIKDLKLGTILVPNPLGYTRQKEVSGIEKLFHENKPEHILIDRFNCVFLTDNIDDIDNLGGFTDFIFEVDIEDNIIEKSDLSWYTKAFLQLEEGNREEARESALNYWNGVTLEGVFEYRVNQCIIKNIVDF